MTNIAIENGHLYWIFPLKMVIFHSYVNLLEGSYNELTFVPIMISVPIIIIKLMYL